MKEPEIPYNSGKYIYMNPFDDTTLISKIYIHPDLMDGNYYQENWLDNNEDKTIDQMPPIEEWGYNEEVFSVQDIIDKVPNGTDINNILITIKRDRTINHIEVNVISRKPTDKKAWDSANKKEEEDYERRLAIYEKEKAKYDEWKIKQDIKDLEKKLAKLKK